MTGQATFNLDKVTLQSGDLVITNIGYKTNPMVEKRAVRQKMNIAR